MINLPKKGSVGKDGVELEGCYGQVPDQDGSWEPREGV